MSDSDEYVAPDEAFIQKVKRTVAFGQLRDCLFLVKNGVPYDVAFSLTAEDRLAYTIILGELDGGVKWSWHSMRFEPVQSG